MIRFAVAAHMLRVWLWLGIVALAGCSLHTPLPDRWPASRSIPVTRMVHHGDTLYSIAWRFRLDYKVLAAWNGIRAPYTIFPGQRLRLRAPPSSHRAGAQRKTTPTRTRPARRTARTRTTKKPVARPAVGKVQKPVHWKWPTAGKIVRTFSRGSNTRTGVDVAGKRGQLVRAARAGEVVYSGNGLIGYGELIIIKHSESFLSAYGHNSVRLVKEGQQVNAGSAIARMGVGKDNKPLLHFEIRYRGNPVDPLRYLPKR